MEGSWLGRAVLSLDEEGYCVNLKTMNTDTDNNDRDNKNDRKPDPPGDELFVHRNVNTHFDSTSGSMSTVTGPQSFNIYNQDHPSTIKFTQNESVPSMSYSMNSTAIPQNKSSLSSSDYWLNDSPKDSLLMIACYSQWHTHCTVI